jgi:hypothetical protein
LQWSYFLVFVPVIMLASELRALENGPDAPCTMALVMKLSAAAKVGLVVVVSVNFVATDDEELPELPTKFLTMSPRMGATSLSTLG